MTYYTRQQVLELLDLDESLFLALEREEIVVGDAPSGAEGGEFSERMLERARVAANLVQELDVNLPGAAIIVRLREELAELRRRMAEVLAELERRGARE